jgi:hypothetical protein
MYSCPREVHVSKRYINIQMKYINGIFIYFCILSIFHPDACVSAQYKRIYIYIHIYIYVYIYIHTHTFIYINSFIYINKNIYLLTRSTCGFFQCTNFKLALTLLSKKHSLLVRIHCFLKSLALCN